MTLITPAYISNFISFKYGDMAWNYDVNGPNDIPRIQAEGSAKLWNLLQQRNIALCADEVGMGKTYQALAIIITLWHQKPNAKILLYAPNENVAKKWVNEYKAFIRYHYKFTDDKIKSSINGQPLRDPIYCENQLELLKKVNLEWPALYICKTSSLSNFLSKKITQKELNDLKIDIIKDVDDRSTDEAKESWMIRFALKCNDFIHKKLSKQNENPFDLIVFDEAHYLRNAEADTNRSLVAHAFFARRDKRDCEKLQGTVKFLSQKVLLLTATPNHSSSRNIESIVSIFNDSFTGVPAADILNQICVRRFRRLNNKTKHQYRKELDEPVEMTDPKEKLFFSMYQRALVKHKAEQFKKNKESTKNQNPYKLLYGYLEGFEFLPNKRTEEVKKSSEQNKSTDFEERDDKRIIQELSEQHNKIYGLYPIHPKYKKTVENLSPVGIMDLHLEKKVVFVRRIPSVFELSRRIIEAYDHQFTRLLIDSKAFDFPADFEQWSEFKLRKHFATEAKSVYTESEDLPEDDTGIDEATEEDQINVTSKYYSLFTIKKEGNFRTTDCSNFRNRFLKEYQLFSIFFQPGADYLGANYQFNNYLYQNDKRDYGVTARKQRFDSLDKIKQDYLFSYISIPSDLETKPGADLMYPTLFTIWIKAVEFSEAEALKEAYDTYLKFSEIEKEAFSNYLLKGLLFASSYLIHFYASFKAISKYKTLKPDELYIEFCKSVENDMEARGLDLLIAKAVSSFQIFYKKELDLTAENLLQEKWTFLNNTQPVYPVCAQTNRSSILKAFNTPFYPNVLVATSVLQEGVDLHYHCNEVIHYGLAWTQGDNEQRVGRIDRLNGKMENQLRKTDNAILPIHYPYLKNTIDQDQTARFIIRKKEAEKLIDQFIPIDQSSEINYFERIEGDAWKKGFNIPQTITQESKDPFPVICEKDFFDIDPLVLRLKDSTESKTILKPVLSAMAKEFKSEFYIYNFSKHLTDNKIFAIRHVRANQRHQPVIAEFNYYEAGLHILSKPVFYIRVKTPIYRRGYKYDNLAWFGKQKEVYANNPVLKIGFENSRKDEFKYFVCVDLPLFYIDGTHINLSEVELVSIVRDLINFADDLEKVYSDDNLDITNESIIEDNLPMGQMETAALSHDRGNGADRKWQTIDNYLYKEESVDKFDLMNHMYSLNMNIPFIKYYRNNRKDWRCVGFYKNDALAEETKLYNYIYENDNM